MWQSCWREAALPWARLAQTCSLLGFLPRKEQAERGWGTPLAPCWPAHPEADSLGAQQLPHTRSLPRALLPSRDVCSWLGPAPACLGSRPQPQLRAGSP